MVSAEMATGFRTRIKCSHPFVIDQSKTTGEKDEIPNPFEIFLSSLPACVCAVVRIITMLQRIDIPGIVVDVEGDIEKDFLLGKTEEGRSGFTEIRACIYINAKITNKGKQILLKEIAFKCPIADNFAHNFILKLAVVVKELMKYRIRFCNGYVLSQGGRRQHFSQKFFT